MTSSQRRTGGGGRARTSKADDPAAPDAPEAAPDAPEAAAPDAPEAAAPDAPEAAPDAPEAAAPDAETPGLIDRAKARLGIGGDGDDGDGDEAATDGPEEPSSDGEHTCVHPTCEDPTIPAGEDYFMATQGPAQGPMHHSCSHKTIPIRR